MIVYIDEQHKCYTENAEGRTAVEIPWMDGKCRTYIVGYCFFPFDGNMEAAWPWKPYAELDAAQRAYEHTRYEAAIAAVDTLLLQMGGAV